MSNLVLITFQRAIKMSITNSALKTASTKQNNLFKIGAVSRITNIPVDTLRIWERRYSVVVPFRSENSDRLYKTEDINRLTLLKMLVDRGHAIGTVAKLENKDLIDRLEIHDQNTISKDRETQSNESIKITVIGDVLPIQIQHTQLNNPGFIFTSLFQTEAEFNENRGEENPDILILEYPAIQEDHIQRISEIFKVSGAKKLILIYGFTNSAAKKSLKKTDYTYLHAPVTLDHLQSEILHLIKKENLQKVSSNNSNLDDKAPLRTYTNNQLINLSSSSPTIKCECPQHLSSMILKLVQFEVYSAECVSRYKKDAELHTLLGNMTGHARSIMEQALTKVIEAEGLA